MNTNLRSYWENIAEKNPSKPFLYFEDEVVTYQGFDRRVNQAANGFCELGIKRGERVCLFLPNLPEFLYCWFALNKIGAVTVPVNIHFKAKEAQYVVNHCGAAGIVASQEYLSITRQIQKECPDLRWIACADMERDQLPGDVTSFSELSRGMPDILPATDVTGDDLASVLYTSGTTGFPKGVMHVQRTSMLAGEAFVLRAGLDAADRVMAILPFFHMNSQFYSTWGAIAAGASLVLIRRFSASEFWSQAVRYDATEFNFVGTIGAILCARPEREFNAAHNIRVAIGAGISPAVYGTFTERFKIPHVLDAYGMTEVPAVSQNPIGGPIKMKSIGLPAKHPTLKPFSEMKIADDDGHDPPVGTVGEILVKSPAMMKGYYREPEKTHEAIRGGWFHTGDQGFQDKDGYFHFVDRKKDIIRKGGENISATEVETVLNEHPAVLESAVIPVPSELEEDEVMACVVLQKGHSVSVEEIWDWCRERLADFKLPRFVQFRDSLPKTSTERIAKGILKSEEGLLKNAVDLGDRKKLLG
ncbi:MAG: AMP-binding protein [Deltaproteobacteria bacterium]|nr:AMP-binding protein [Deltaproteobacteria bacterium]